MYTFLSQRCQRCQGAKPNPEMPTLLSWTYIGKHAIAESGEAQRLYVGETGLDDVLGEVTVLSLSGGSLTVTTSERDAAGKLKEVERTVGHIRAKVMRGPVERAAATGRPGQPKGSIFQFLGRLSNAALPDGAHMGMQRVPDQSRASRSRVVPRWL